MSKFKLTPIGTCRIHNPIRIAAGKYPIEPHMPRTYGFTHTSREALQQLSFLEGQLDFPPELVPGIFRGNTKPQDYTGEWRGADLVMVEISSLKLLTAGDFWLQTRYLNEHFADFFGSPARSKAFWNFAGREPEGLLPFLEQEPAYRALSEPDQQLLRSVRMRQQTFDELQEDVAALVDRIGIDKILFVTHVDAVDDQGRPLPSRQKLIRWVERAAADLEAPCFNPTELMREFGQERAMERGGVDTTHYTEPFYGAVYDHVHRHFIAPLVQRVLGSDAGLDGETHIQMLADAVSATMQHVDLVTGARQLHAALRANRDSPPLIELRGILSEKLGDFESAVEDLSGAAAQGHSLGTGAREALMRALVETGDAKQALEVVDSLIAQEHESVSLHQVAARAAERLGLDERALTHSKQLWRLDRSDVQTAIRVLSRVSAEGPQAEAEWRDEIAYFASKDAKLAQAAARHALATKDSALFASATEALAGIDAGSAGDLLLHAQGSDLILAASKAIGQVLQAPELPNATLKALRDIGRRWGADSIAFAEQGRFDEAAPLAVASFDALGEEHGGLRGLRGVAASMLHRARELAAGDDHQGVIALCEDKPVLVMARPRLALEMARALSAVGRGDEATSVAREAAERFPEDAAIVVTAARLLRDSDLAAAARFYGIAAERDAQGRYAEEIAGFSETAPVKAAERINESIGNQSFEAALDLLPVIAARDPASADKERSRIHAAMRRALQDSSDSAEQKRTILAQLLSVVPDDPHSLRDAAIDAMERKAFAEALELWERLAAVAPDLEAAHSGLVRCRVLVGEADRATAKAS